MKELKKIKSMALKLVNLESLEASVILKLYKKQLFKQK